MSAARWEEVDGFPGYEVSDCGEVRRAGKLKTQMSDRKGYLWVSLWLHGKSYTRYISRLVAAAFIGPRPVGEEVRHRNGINTDNRSENLQYGTRTENEHDKRAHGTAPIGINHPSAKLTEEQVYVIRARYRKNSRIHGTNALSADFGVSGRAILNVVARLTWSHLP